MAYTVRLNKKVWLCIILIISLISLAIRYTIFTEKYFIDSNGLMSIERNLNITGMLPVDEGSFQSAAIFFYYINFFDLNSLMEWTIYISILFFLINFYLVKDIKLIELKNFLLLITGLLLWYLFGAGITKEIIQSLFFIIVYMVICSDKIKYTWIKFLIGIIIIYFSSILFREYFILMAVFAIYIYIISIMLKKKNLSPKYYYIWMIIFSMILVTFFLFIISIILPEQYSFIMILRTDYYYTQLMEVGTDSLITALVPGESLLIYMINYIITYFRLLIPIELLFNIKIQYIPFVVYQLSFTYYYIKNISMINIIDDKKFIALVFLTAYILVSAIMEPDFGSWVRHQTATYSLMLILLKY
mgnify:CR=1 FL=1